MTGGILCRITGADFVNKPPVTVRFATRRAFVDAEGEYVSDSELLCTLPNFEKCGSVEVQVRVSLKGDSFTTTYQKFRFFQVTASKFCTAFGPALISGGAAGFRTLFHIVAVDKDGKARTSGGDLFEVTSCCCRGHCNHCRCCCCRGHCNHCRCCCCCRW